jgi:hypothetical protein
MKKTKEKRGEPNDKPKIYARRMGRKGLFYNR